LATPLRLTCGVSCDASIAASSRGDLRLAASAWDPQSDVLIAVCLNFRSHLVIDALEARIGKPVVTSTQAVLCTYCGLPA
jgi:maleate isomerase